MTDDLSPLIFPPQILHQRPRPLFSCPGVGSEIFLPKSSSHCSETQWHFSDLGIITETTNHKYSVRELAKY
jgi:hypothetical protein